MAAIPPLRRLQIEDFKTEKNWIAPLLLVINNFQEAVVGALSKALTLVENSTSDVKTLLFDGNYPVSAAWSKDKAPIAVLVGNVQRQDGASFSLGAAVQVQWAMSSDGKSLQISAVTGLTLSATSQFYLTLICIAG